MYTIYMGLASNSLEFTHVLLGLLVVYRNLQKLFARLMLSLLVIHMSLQTLSSRLTLSYQLIRMIF